MALIELPVGGILKTAISILPKLYKWGMSAKQLVAEWHYPYPKYWRDDTQRFRRRLLFGLHSPPGFWMQPGNNTWKATDADTGEEVVYAPDGVPRPTFNYRGYRQLFAVGEKANELFTCDHTISDLYPNRLYLGGKNINMASSMALAEVETAHTCGLEPLRFRTNIVEHPPHAYERLEKIERVFIEDGMEYRKKAVVDEHQFLLDTKGELKPGPRVEDGKILEDFLLISILPNAGRTGRIINVVARYGACERLHDLFLYPDIVNEIWEDKSSTRRKSDGDMRYPWVQALFSVNVYHYPDPEKYQRPQLKHVHWMPEYGPILEDRTDLYDR